MTRKHGLKGIPLLANFFDVEGSLRQGRGLSVSLYGKHASKTVEDLVKGGKGTKVGREGQQNKPNKPGGAKS